MPQHLGPMMEFYDKIVGPARLTPGLLPSDRQSCNRIPQVSKKTNFPTAGDMPLRLRLAGLHGIHTHYDIQTDPESVMTFGSVRKKESPATSISVRANVSDDRLGSLVFN